jgi:hypothetical protein
METVIIGQIRLCKCNLLPFNWRLQLRWSHSPFI